MTPAFLTDLDAKLLTDGSWELCAPLIYQSTEDTYTVPSGFVTDFASVPRLPVVYVLTANTAHKAAVVHDYLYRTGKVSRMQADAIFKEAMEVSGVPWWRRQLMWLGVRAMGGTYYQEARLL